ncbi:MAG: hypothetical protein Q8R92_08675 [Deltaproteobacteria bacterium]|nr:hypothetical protein [Deltaproteobacteria bacterium]
MAFVRRRKFEDRFLNGRGQVKEVQDLGHAGPRDAGEPGQIGVLLDYAGSQ